MNCHRYRLSGLIAGMFALCSAAAMASGLDAIIKECNSCHGENGVSLQPEIPIIAGLSGFYIEGALHAYRDDNVCLDDARPCVEAKYSEGPKKGEAITMCEVPEALSEEQIVALGKHYEALPFVPAEQEFDSAKAELGEQVHERLCEKCHAEGGSDPLDDAGLLAGQWSPYLERAFTHFRSGVRDSEQKMVKAMKGLSDEEMDALIHYYASLSDKYE